MKIGDYATVFSSEGACRHAFSASLLSFFFFFFFCGIVSVRLSMDFTFVHHVL